MKGRSMTNSSKHQQQKGFARVAPVLAILFVIALGALAAPQYQDRDRGSDRDRDRDRGGLSVSRESVVVDFGGGRGGRPSRDAMCELGSVAVGFHVQAGEFFNPAWLDCVRVRRDGDLGDQARMTDRTGSPGGRPVHDAFCPDGFVLRGLRGRTGASIDEATGACSPVREIARHFDNVRTEFTEVVARPYAGGRPAGVDCPPGFAVTGLRSNSGEYMDHLWLVCSELRWDRDN